MKRNRINYNESKDQSLPFALPALRSYKQSLLFPENHSKRPESSDFDSFHFSDTISSPLRPTKKALNSETASRSPNSKISPYRSTKKPLKPLLPNKEILKKPEIPAKKPIIGKKKQEESQSKPLKAPSSKIKPFSELKPAPNATNSNKNSEILGKKQENKPIAEKVPLKNLSHQPRHKTPQSYHSGHLRSNSISSSSSLKQGIIPRTPQINSISSKHGLTESHLTNEPIPEFTHKRNARVTGTRSVSRKRPKKRSFFDIDFGPFKMSDLSIYPLL